PLAFFFTLVFAGAYTSVLHCLAGQTIGKMLVGVRVVAGEDEPPLFGTALLRFVAYFASAGTFTLGFVMAGLRQDKRALHDLIAGTRVERLRALEASLPPIERLWACAGGVSGVPAARWDQHHYFDVHKLLEPSWRQAEGGERETLQGLIQVAVGYQHLANGNLAGARALLGEGCHRLSGRTLEGMDLEAFGREVART